MLTKCHDMTQDPDIISEYRSYKSRIRQRVQERWVYERLVTFSFTVHPQVAG